MCGIYFHIPFCYKKCYYCDFFSVSNSSSFEDLIESEIKELVLRRNYLSQNTIKTIYFGGGTPTILDIKYLKRLLEAVYSNFNVSNECEISIEANPDNLSDVYLNGLFQIGFNRLSIGIQSFNNDVLKFLGRKHSGDMLSEIIMSAKKIGFDNISVDLIYGIPGFDDSVYLSTLNSAMVLDIQHVSAYGLSIAKDTLFDRKLRSRQFVEIDEDDYIRQFLLTMDILDLNGFKQYEISNFAKNGFISRHNSSYWSSIPYLGIGPSAHSYNGFSRQWNISNLFKYLKLIVESQVFYNIEELSSVDKYNEYVLTGIRTSSGLNIDFIKEKFDQLINDNFRFNTDRLLGDGYLIQKLNHLSLSRKGIVLCDFVIQQLYYS
jgi:oxygen-independent coproporphyrinogen-3 oxidase